MKILIITDHSTYAPTDAIYPMTDRLASMENLTFALASRGDQRNKHFFFSHEMDEIYAVEYERQLTFENHQTWFAEPKKRKLLDFDGVFLRIDQPVTTDFLESLAKFENQMPIINRPSSLIETSTKRFLLNFPDLVPGITDVPTFEELLKISATRDIVLKPIKGWGGEGITKVVSGEMIFGDNSFMKLSKVSAIEAFEKITPCVAMDYLNHVNEGDKRILVFKDKVLGAMLRVPAPGSWLANVHKGASVEHAEVDEAEFEIIEQISPVLYDKGVIFFGFDTLMGNNGKRVLSELDPVNPGGFGTMERFSGKPIISEFMADIVNEFRTFDN